MKSRCCGAGIEVVRFSISVAWHLAVRPRPLPVDHHFTCGSIVDTPVWHEQGKTIIQHCTHLSRATPEAVIPKMMSLSSGSHGT